ncbi:Histidine kinase [Filimonas lacunae]|uniref:Histidine kinase n=1 Tax=Filimonas lacunae TaxID=477680 RepID=A0A173MEA1_9BACT|nr:histidine kinase [Filimonas lacunae]BAV05847.1 two-component system sensor protein histidine kinase [Filimonas lacunae]SIT28387.1 Histidine kinase [Filimonas lacunae]
MKRTLLLLCLLVLYLTACKQKPAGREASAPVVAGINETTAILNRLIDQESRIGADSMSRQLIALEPHVKDTVSKAYYLYLKGNRYLRNKDADSADLCYRAMLDSTGIDTVRNLDVFLLQHSGLLRASMDTVIDDHTFERLRPLIKLAEKYKYPNLWRLYNLGAETYFRYGDSVMPEIYTRMAIAQYPRKNDLFQQSVFMEQLSRSYEKKKDHTTAFLYEDSAMYYARQLNDKRRLASVYSALGVLHINTGDTAVGHVYLDSSFALKRELNEITYNDWLNMGMEAIEKHTPAKAIPLLKEALAIAKKQKNQDMLNRAYGTIYEALWQMGDYKNAIRYMDSSSIAAMRAMYQQQYKQVAKMEAINNLKEEQLKTIALNKENENKAIQLRQQRWLIIILAALLLLAVGVGYLLVERRRLRNKKRNIELEQQLLRSQMEPHFIFNTLSVLQSFIRNNEPEKATKYLNQFARLLRINLENSRENLVALKEEVEALENYLSLQAMRFEGVFEYRVHAFEGYEEEEIYIPPMLLQPFVENAIQHGMRNLAYKGHIEVNIRLKGQALYCTIEDNGAGLQQHEKQVAKKSLSGIITQERLAILSRQTHQPATLVITDRQQQGQKGLKVEMVIPVRRRSV